MVRVMKRIYIIVAGRCGTPSVIRLLRRCLMITKRPSTTWTPSLREMRVNRLTPMILLAVLCPRACPFTCLELLLLSLVNVGSSPMLTILSRRRV